MKYDQKSSHKLPAQVTVFLLSVIISYADTIATGIFFIKIKKIYDFLLIEMKTPKNSSCRWTFANAY